MFDDYQPLNGQRSDLFGQLCDIGEYFLLKSCLSFNDVGAMPAANKHKGKNAAAFHLF